jgi:hypothetical protein
VIEGLGSLEAADGSPERAVRLFGAAAALRETLGTPLSPARRPEQDRQLATLSRVLGDAAFTTAWAAGQAMPLDQAISLALQEAPSG